MQILEVFSALCDPDRLAVFQHVAKSGPQGVSQSDLGTSLGFSSLRLATAMQWLKRAEVIDVQARATQAQYVINQKTLMDIKSTLGL